ncbi:MAG TPA: AMP-binding protein, partial [Ktedonobacteraceae bacterium]|nr:AMP-binding protein [Ktedonobacteraceae bacterium]
MTDIPAVVSSGSTPSIGPQARLQMELFRPPLHYPVHPYAELLAHTAEKYPENEAMLTRDVTLTYRELNALVNMFANALLTQGIQKGQKVCLFMMNRAEYMISWVAAARIGAVVSQMNPSYKEREVAYQMHNCEAAAVIVQYELLPLVQAVRAEVPSLRQVIVIGAGGRSLPVDVISYSRILQAQ